MAFPDSKLSKTVRRIIMTSVFILFFITAPIILSYTAGYRYNLGNGKIERTGVISLDATPNDADFYINDKLIGQKSPLRIPNVAPGSYHISIRKSNYHPFEKDIIVQSQQTTYIKNIFLYANTLSEKYYTKDIKIREMKVSPTGNYFLSIQSPNSANLEKTSLILTNTRNGEEQILREIKTGESLDFSWSPYTDFILLKNKNSLSILSAETPVSVRTETFDENTQYIWGHSSSAPEILVRAGDKVRILTKIGLTDIATTTATAWFVDTKGQLWTADDDKILVQQNPNQPRAYSLPNKPISIIDIDEKRAIIETEGGITIIKFTGGEPEIHTISSAVGYYFNTHTREWLIWTDWELWSIYTDGSATILNRTGEKIISARPLDKYGVLLITTPKGIFAFNPGYYVTQELIPANNVSEAGANAEKRLLYFLGKVGEKIDIYQLKY
ncbi:MAG TPA: PEGA domain-containing protein [Candidatus Magasanikbacteria bacterium]|nr:PEGA domain-containing protein [Candidatus Magasanikbacteria bacterium]